VRPRGRIGLLSHCRCGRLSVASVCRSLHRFVALAVVWCYASLRRYGHHRARGAEGGAEPR
jgi:hypothetical protein